MFLRVVYWLSLVGSDSNLAWFQVSTLIVVENMNLSDYVILSLKSLGDIFKSMDGGSNVLGIRVK